MNFHLSLIELFLYLLAIPTPLTNRLTAAPDQNEQKLHLQSAHNMTDLPKIQTTNPLMNKVSFKADQHKYHPQTPTYHFPKHLSTIELLAKKYPSSNALENNTGLVWYNANEQTV